MGKLAILKFQSNPSNSGYTVSLRIYGDRYLPSLKIEGGNLPEYPSEIRACYSLWKDQFKNYRMRSDREDWEFGVVEQRLELEDEAEPVQGIVDSLEMKFNSWLRYCSDSKWIEIRDRLISEIAKNSGNIRVAIESDPQLWKLPWSEWSIFKDRLDRGVSHHLENYSVENNKYNRENCQSVKVLAVFGDSSGGLNFDGDREAIERLKTQGAEIVSLVKPSYEEFIDRLQHPEGWDILFFAGHGSTQNQIGKIWLDENTYIKISNFKNAIQKAVKQGLKIAIFNCCEGMGLVLEIADYKIPTVIYMQEKVSDRVAQFFVKDLLTEYSNNQSLDVAFQRTQSRLERFNKECPGTHWLPKLYQNPGEEPLSWEQLRGNVASVPIKPEDTKVEKNKRLPSSNRKHLLRIILISILVTSLVMGMRWFGFLQTSELQAFDRLMQQRPAENADPRILVVGGEEADIEKYGQYPLPDGILSQLIDKLEEHQPVVIGLDIVRDLPVEPGHKELVTHFQQNKHLISPCAIPTKEKEEIKPPPQALKENLGFVDLPPDLPYNTVRRYVLTRNSGVSERYEQCTTDHSLAFQLAYRYLYFKGIKGILNQQANAWQFRDVIFKELQPHSGGYHKLYSWGRQILLNYRVPASKNSTSKNSNIAQFASFRQILENRFKPEWIEDKIILIAMTAESAPDWHNTTQGRMRGVWIHAQMVSQILSSVEDKRPLIWWLPVWGDILWVEVLSIVGGMLVFYGRSRPLYLITGISISILLLYFISFISILQGLWLPLIPSVIVLLIAGCTSAIYFSKYSYR